MDLQARRAFWFETIGMALLSVACFRLGFLLLVFLVPIQVAWLRRGEAGGLIASALMVAIVTVIATVIAVRSTAQSGSMDGMPLIDIAVAAGPLLGLAVINGSTVDAVAHRFGLKRDLTVAERVLLVAVVAAVFYAPVLLVVSSSGAGDRFLDVQASFLRQLLGESDSASGEIEATARLLVDVFVSGMIVVVLLLVLGSWWAGRRLVLRPRSGRQPDNEVFRRAKEARLAAYVIPAPMVWILIGAWIGVVLTMVTDLGQFRHVVWNAALVMLVVYAGQGMAIGRHLLDRRGVSQGARIGVAIGLIVVLMVPGLNLVVIVGLPALGVSEVWIDYHRLEAIEDTE